MHRADAPHGSPGGWAPRNELENIKAQTPPARCRGASAGPYTESQGTRPLCSGATKSRGSGVQNLEDTGAAAGSALRAGPSRQTAVREAGAVWHSRHFSTSIKPARSRPRGRGKGAQAVGSSPPAAAPPTPRLRGPTGAGAICRVEGGCRLGLGREARASRDPEHAARVGARSQSLLFSEPQSPGL